MYNWSVNINKLSKYQQQYTIWRLEQLINFGLNGEKINLSELKKYLPNLHIDPAKKKYITFLLNE